MIKNICTNKWKLADYSVIHFYGLGMNKNSKQKIKEYGTTNMRAHMTIHRKPEYLITCNYRSVAFIFDIFRENGSIRIWFN